MDFATPVQSFSVFPQGDNVRMVIEPKGLWEHNAYQTDTQFVLEVKPIQYDPNKLVQGSRSGYSGEKLSLNFQNVEVRSVLNVIADFTDLNIITSDTVGGNLTLRLKDVPWDQALDIILQTRGLDMRKNGNVIWIAPRDELGNQGETRAGVERPDHRARAVAHRNVPAQLLRRPMHLREAPCRSAAAHPVQARRRVVRSPHESSIRPGRHFADLRKCAGWRPRSTSRCSRC